MQVSARILGQEFALNAQETNLLLKKEGFLEGEPGNYYPTEKASKYVEETEHNKGYGGYAQHSRYSTRTFDDSIKDELNVTPEILDEVRAECAAERAARRAERKANCVKLDEILQTSKSSLEQDKNTDDDNFVRGLTIIGVIGFTGYEIVRHVVVPGIKSWWAKNYTSK